MIDFTGAQNGGGEMAMVGGVRKLLRFQAKATSPSMGLPLFAASAAIEKVAAVKLQPRLIGEKFHSPAGRRMGHICSKSPFAALI